MVNKKKIKKMNKKNDYNYYRLKIKILIIKIKINKKSIRNQTLVTQLCMCMCITDFYNSYYLCVWGSGEKFLEVNIKQKNILIWKIKA